VKDGNVEIIESKFNNIMSNGMKGCVIYGEVKNGKRMNIEGCTFENTWINSKNGKGGAIYCKLNIGGKFIIDKTSSDNNNNEKSTIFNLCFAGNKISENGNDKYDGYGGGIYLELINGFILTTENENENEKEISLKNISFNGNNAEYGNEIFIEHTGIDYDYDYLLLRETLSYISENDAILLNDKDLSGTVDNYPKVIPLKYYWLTPKNPIFVSSDGMNINACGFLSIPCNTLQKTISRFNNYTSDNKIIEIVSSSLSLTNSLTEINYPTIIQSSSSNSIISSIFINSELLSIIIFDVQFDLTIKQLNFVFLRSSTSSSSSSLSSSISLLSNDITGSFFTLSASLALIDCTFSPDNSEELILNNPFIFLSNSKFGNIIIRNCSFSYFSLSSGNGSILHIYIKSGYELSIINSEFIECYVKEMNGNSGGVIYIEINKGGKISINGKRENSEYTFIKCGNSMNVGCGGAISIYFNDDVDNHDILLLKGF
jgi:hypothetical protein